MRLEWGEEDPGLSPRPEPPSLDLHCHRTGHVVGLGPAEVWGGRRGDSRGRARRARWAVRFRSSSLSWPGDECLPPVLGLRRRRATGTPIRTPRFPRPRARGGKGRLRAAARGPRLPLTLRVRVKETPSAAPTPRSPQDLMPGRLSLGLWKSRGPTVFLPGGRPGIPGCASQRRRPRRHSPPGAAACSLCPRHGRRNRGSETLYRPKSQRPSRARSSARPRGRRHPAPAGGGDSLRISQAPSARSPLAQGARPARSGGRGRCFVSGLKGR